MTRKPNFVFFMTDQQQGDTADPAHPCRMPHVDRLAREGIRFSRAFTNSPHCCPSRATFQSGLYPSRHGIFNNVLTPTAINKGLNTGVRLFSEDLVDAGYRCMHAGKWHVSGEENPGDRGWEELIVDAHTNASHHRTIEQWRNEPTRDEESRPRGGLLRPGWGTTRLYRTYESQGPRGYEHTNDYKFAAAACEAIETLDADRPFCMFVGMTGPHDPYFVPQRLLDLYPLEDIPLPASYSDTLHDKPNIYRRHREQIWGQLTPDEVREAIAHYWAYCTMQDELLGDVIAALEARGLFDDTIFVFLSDHGDYMGAHGLFCKGVPAFREGYHIPCIIRAPQKIPDKSQTSNTELMVQPGSVCDELVNLADFAPTLLDLAGIDYQADRFTGRSLRPLLGGERPEGWRTTHFTQMNGVELYYTQRACFDDRFKFVYNGFDFDELYDLQQDPHETVNLAADPAYRDTVDEMMSRIWAFAAEQDDELIMNPYLTVALAPRGPAATLNRTASAPS